jgi:transposase-like protein
MLTVNLFQYKVIIMSKSKDINRCGNAYYCVSYEVDAIINDCGNGISILQKMIKKFKKEKMRFPSNKNRKNQI